MKCAFTKLSYFFLNTFLVIILAIAQRIVDNTILPILSAGLLNPKTDSVSFTLHTSLKVPGGLRIRTNDFNFSLFNRHVKPTQPYLSVGLPSYSLKGNTDMVVTHNDTMILDQAKFVQTLSQAVCGCILATFDNLYALGNATMAVLAVLILDHKR